MTGPLECMQSPKGEHICTVDKTAAAKAFQSRALDGFNSYRSFA